MIDELSVRKFQLTVWAYYRNKGRHDLPWRQAEANGSFDAYKIMVSEVMLQQTQVSRVIPKYQDFIKRFPDVKQLAAADQGEVVRVWSGLGYNRRAKFLHLAAKEISSRYDGIVPATAAELVQLPGIGPNTAGAILAYALNCPVAFIETNIRSVFIHHFFEQQADVTDRAILELVQQTLDEQQPRKWYWALMDYGVYLKQLVSNPNQRSRHYAKQSKFQGSRRQLRGQVLRLLSNRPYTKAVLAQTIDDERLPLVLSELVDEKLIQRHGTRYRL
jgi:A/G-specific adenine glycosylase